MIYVSVFLHYWLMKLPGFSRANTLGFQEFSQNTIHCDIHTVSLVLGVEPLQRNLMGHDNINGKRKKKL